MTSDAVNVSEKQSFLGAGSRGGSFTLGFGGGQGQTVDTLPAFCEVLTIYISKVLLGSYCSCGKSVPVLQVSCGADRLSKAGRQKLWINRLVFTSWLCVTLPPRAVELLRISPLQGRLRMSWDKAWTLPPQCLTDVSCLSLPASL